MATLADPREGPGLALPRRQPARLRGRARRPAEFRPFDLTVNCRNTQAIAREVHKKYYGRDRARDRSARRAARSSCCAGRDDSVDDRSAHGRPHLIEKEEVPPQDIVVLSSHSLERSEIGAGRAAGSVRLRRQAGAVVRRSVLVDPRASRASSRRWSSSASSRTSTRRRATSSSTSGCRGRRTTA